MKRILVVLTLPLFLIACNSDNNNTKPATPAALVKAEPVKNSAKKMASEKHQQNIQQTKTMTKEVVVVAATTPQRIVHEHAMQEIVVAAIQPHSPGAQANVHGHPGTASNVHGHDSQQEVVVAAGSDVVIYEND
jgi:uncharacterized lipoprotein YajG